MPTRHPLSLLLHPRSPLPHIKQVHAQLVAAGLAGDGLAAGPLLAACSLSPSSPLDYALAVFDRIAYAGAFARNTIIRGFAERGEPRHGIALYARFASLGAAPNNYSFPFVLKSCARAAALPEGEQIHGHALKLGFAADVFVANALVHFYGCCGRTAAACQVFDGIPHRDVVSWNALLAVYVKDGQIDEARLLFDGIPRKDEVSWSTLASGYVRNGLLEEGLMVFDSMRESGAPANEALVVTVLSATAQLGMLEKGQSIHDYIKSSGIPISNILATALIDTYMRCGSVDRAHQVFVSSIHRGVSAWNAMICGLAIHGHGRDALNLFNSFLGQGLQPDKITFVGLLSACSHSGLVEDGRLCFKSMREGYGIEPEMEHYGCMVDLLGRAGMVYEAEALIKEMPGSPDPVIWGMLLNACRIHGNTDLGERIGKMLLNLQPYHDGNYVLLSGIYAREKRWGDVLQVRELMKDRLTTKVPGWSLIEADGRVHRFVMGDREHPRSGEIHMMLNEIQRRLKCAGYVPNTSPVLHDIEDEEKEHVIAEHSERLAMAFGLIVIDPGCPIRIIKNLRVCWDCHEVIKMISEVFDRELIIRDGSRFHHFKLGRCSCLDYW
ncbi:pentatricopeptide repeat-containing protein At5g66520-like [Nymphaea colorata]|uniref:DYW domain-containing protein n=1 Tax=Nymphaea colorata TaxID=210225 RepID=A0A5K0UXE3_9MAGN|nr:pentatricopeptide repeat-containing protein At5g66520-like [Nymphaea colorata]XP_031473117.1 pentatricopeptide repeat-containing protein At5g66520-like [Nymphaea colorata]